MDECGRWLSAVLEGGVTLSDSSFIRSVPTALKHVPAHKRSLSSWAEAHRKGSYLVPFGDFHSENMSLEVSKI